MALIFRMEQDEIKRRFEEAGQGHVFRYWGELTPDEQAQLVAQAGEVDLDELGRLIRGSDAGGEQAWDLEPAPYIALPEDRHGDPDWKRARQRGEELLRAGKVAAFTVAGGQGTRLGFDGPKGTFPVTPVREKPLFQVFAEKTLAAGRHYGVSIPWLIMTSHANHEATVEFFEKNEYFGLSPENLFFFRQGRMPAVDFDGNILLASKSSIAMSPDGHGGSLRALVRGGVLEKIRARGIEVISYFQVDNPLVRVIDPWFIGFHAEAGSEMSSKMLPKAHPEEKVGVFCIRDGRLCVVEYSDLPDEVARATDDRGNIRFAAGSIAIHLLDVDFVRRIAGSGGDGAGAMPFHRAKKKVPHLNENGEPVSPSEPNAIKFEMFVFDALPEAENPVVIETAREDEFSPVKNATGEDSKETCFRDQLKQFARWFRGAGVDLPTGEDGVPVAPPGGTTSVSSEPLFMEVSPLFAWDEETFRKAWENLPEKPAIRAGLYLE